MARSSTKSRTDRYLQDTQRDMIWIGKGSSWLIVAVIVILAGALAIALN